MKYSVKYLLTVVIVLSCVIAHAKTIMNPYTGKLQYINEFVDTESVDFTVTGTNSVSAVVTANAVDHGSLTGLGDNDHSSYITVGTDTSSLDVTVTGQGFSGVVLPAGVDHGSLAGIADDDHTIYILSDGTRAFTGSQSFGDFNITNLGNISLGNNTLEAAAADMVHLAAQDYGAGDSRLYIQSESGDPIIIGGEKIIFPVEFTPSAPQIAWGDGTYGIFSSLDNNIRFALDGAIVFELTTSVIKFGDGSAGTGRIKTTPGSATDPMFRFTSDEDTGVSKAGADQLSLIAGGVEGIRITEATTITNRLSDKVSVSNTAESNTGSLNIQTTREVHTLSLAATSDTTTISVPSGALILGASFNVNTAVTDDAGDDTWSAAFITGDTSTLATGAAAAQDTKVDTSLVPVKTTDVTEVRFTPNAGSFSAGVIEVQVYYIDLTSLASV